MSAGVKERKMKEREIAIQAAEFALPVYEMCVPGDKRIRDAIEQAKKLSPTFREGR